MSVAEQYVHISKRIEPWEPVTVDGAELKWYEIAPADQPVPADIRALAGTALDTGVFDLRGELGFVLLHRCGESFYFLIVLTWNNDNEVWETVWAKNGEDDPVFAPWPVDGSHRPTFCVWELGAVWHEQQAWSRFLRSPRDHEARQAYLNDSYSGDV